MDSSIVHTFLTATIFAVYHHSIEGNHTFLSLRRNATQRCRNQTNSLAGKCWNVSFFFVLVLSVQCAHSSVVLLCRYHFNFAPSDRQVFPFKWPIVYRALCSFHHILFTFYLNMWRDDETFTFTTINSFRLTEPHCVSIRYFYSLHQYLSCFSAARLMMLCVRCSGTQKRKEKEEKKTHDS